MRGYGRFAHDPRDDEYRELLRAQRVQFGEQLELEDDLLQDEDDEELTLEDYQALLVRYLERTDSVRARIRELAEEDDAA